MIVSATPTPPGGSQSGTAGEHPAPLRHTVSLAALWFGIAGAPAAWSAQLVIAFALSAHTCFPRLVPLRVPEVGSTTLTVLLLTLFAAAFATGGLALLTAVRSWRATSHEDGSDTHDALDVGEGRTRFMALAGVLISSLFLLAVCAQGALVLTVTPCAQQSALVR